MLWYRQRGHVIQAGRSSRQVDRRRDVEQGD